MTNQEMLNRVWEVFITNDEPRSVDARGYCEYGEPSTTGCAVACLLTPEERVLARELELTVPMGLRASELPEHGNFPTLASCDLGFANVLQRWHDTTIKYSDTLAYRRETLAELAARKGLTVPESV